MEPVIRKQFNAIFTEEKYQSFLADLESVTQTKIAFRVAETPIFFDAQQREILRTAGESVLSTILRDDLKEITERAIPEGLRVPNEDEHTLFLALDFAVCRGEDGTFLPQLIELQGFPSLFAYESVLQELYRKHYSIPDNYSIFPDGSDKEAYQQRLCEALLDQVPAENTILLEIEPEKQGTAVDFNVTEQITGIRAVCISKIIREGHNLFYLRDGVKTPVYRIYNRVIFDEFSQRTDLNCQFNLTEDVDVEWAGHPNWFFRISKFLMPFLDSPYVPESWFLSEVSEIPSDLENYVLKPLFSFSGTGVIFHVKPADISAIPESERKNYLLQRKVEYAPFIPAPDGMVKAEVRLLYFWEPGNERPEWVANLSRLSRGEMIGVKFNKDKTWVGGSVSFFES